MHNEIKKIFSYVFTYGHIVPRIELIYIVYQSLRAIYYSTQSKWMQSLELNTAGPGSLSWAICLGLGFESAF